MPITVDKKIPAGSQSNLQNPCSSTLAGVFYFCGKYMGSYFISEETIFSIPFNSASGLNEILSIPHSTKNLAYSG
jgi:hypothetical protein